MSENHWELLILLAESFHQLEAVAEDAPHKTVAVETGGAVRDEEGTMLQEATVEDVVVGSGSSCG